MCFYLTSESREKGGVQEWWGRELLGLKFCCKYSTIKIIHTAIWESSIVFDPHLPIFLKLGNLDLLTSCQSMLVWFLWGKFSSVGLECPNISRNCVWNKTLPCDTSKISHSCKIKGKFCKGFPIQMMTLLAEKVKILWVSSISCQCRMPDHGVSS